jgi:ATP-binding cassette subfamily G (WHITE) protein 2 (SNQ2)
VIDRSVTALESSSKMFYTQSDRMFTEKAEGREGTGVPLHNVNNTGERPRGSEEAQSSGSDYDEETWGERDIGGPVNFRSAMQEYEDMRKDLSNLSKTRSARTEPSNAAGCTSGLRNTITRRSHGTEARTEPELDLEAQEEEKSEEAPEADFQLREFLKEGHFERRQEGRSAKKVGVVYKGLTVNGAGATAAFVKMLPYAIIGVSIPENRYSSIPILHVYFLLSP